MNWKNNFFWILLSLLISTSTFANYKKEAVVVYNKANESLAKKNITQAIKHFNKALSIDNTIFEAYYILGNIYYTQDNFQKALLNYKKALKLNPKHVNSNRYMGTLLLSKGNVKAASNFLKIAYENSPDSLDIVSEYSTALFHLKKYNLAKNILLEKHSKKHFGINYLLYDIFSLENNVKKSLSYLEYAHKINPKPEISNKLASIYIELKDFSEALDTLLEVKNKSNTQYEQIITLYLLQNEVSDAKSFLDKNMLLIKSIDYKNKLSGDVLLAQKNEKLALESYLRIKNKSIFSDLNLKLANIYLNLKDYPSSLKYFKNTLKNNPNSIRLRKKIIQILLQLKLPQKALTYISPILNKSSKDTEVLNMGGTIYYKLGKLPVSKYYFSKSLEINPKQSLPYYNIGLINYNTKHYAMAIVNFEEAIKNKFKDVLVFLYLGNSYFEVKKYDFALKNLKKVLDLDPRNELALRNLGQVYIKQQNHKKAIKTLKSYLKLKPEDSEILYILGKIFSENKKYIEAETYLNKAILLEPTNQDYLFELSALYVKKNELESAKTSLNKILEKNPTYIEANMMIANIYKHQSNFRLALIHYRNITTKENSNIEARENLIKLYLETNQITKAKFHLNKIKYFAPDSQIATWAEGIMEFKNKKYKEAQELLLNTNYDPFSRNLFLGKTFLATNNTNEALKHFKEAHKIDKNNTEVKAYLAILFFIMENYTDSMKLINFIVTNHDNVYAELLYCGAQVEYNKKNNIRSLALANDSLTSKIKLNVPGFSETFLSRLNYLLGQLYYENKEYKKSVKFLKAVKKPVYEINFLQINNLLAESYFKLGMRKSSIFHWDNILRVSEQNTLALLGIARIFSLQNKFSSAIDFATKAFNSTTDEKLKEEILVFKGEEFLKRRNIEESIKSFEAALEINKKNIKNHIKLAEAYFIKKDYKKSISVLHKTLRLNSSNVVALYLLGRCYNELGDYNNATQYFEEIIGFDPKNIDAYFSIIEILIKINKKELALKYLEHTQGIIKDVKLTKSQQYNLKKFTKTLVTTKQ